MSNIWSIGGGKGGSGKSFFAGNLGMLLARKGFRTLLIDADLGAANLHTIIGVPHPEKSLSDFIHKKAGTLEETVVPTHTPNLFLISGAMNSLDVANLAYEQKMKLLRHIARLSYEYVLLDLGAGTSFNTIDPFMISSAGIFIATPEPTSIENIYRLIRSVYFRKIRQVIRTHDFRVLVEEAEKRSRSAAVSHPDLLLQMVKELNPEKGDVLERELQAFQFRLAINQLRKQDNPRTGELICKIIERHLGLRISFAGNISFDDRVHDSVCRKVSFVDRFPYTQTALDLRACCKTLLGDVDHRAFPQTVQKPLGE